MDISNCLCLDDLLDEDPTLLNFDLETVSIYKQRNPILNGNLENEHYPVKEEVDDDSCGIERPLPLETPCPPVIVEEIHRAVAEEEVVFVLPRVTDPQAVVPYEEVSEGSSNSDYDVPPVGKKRKNFKSASDHRRSKLNRNKGKCFPHYCFFL